MEIKGMFVSSFHARQLKSLEQFEDKVYLTFQQVHAVHV